MMLTSRFTTSTSTSTTMILITVMYPAGPEDSFNRGYYLETHIPLVKERWSSMGLESVQLLRGIASGDGREPVYQVIALLSFPSFTAGVSKSRSSARPGNLRRHPEIHVGAAGGPNQRSARMSALNGATRVNRAAGVACATSEPGTETQARQFVRIA